MTKTSLNRVEYVVRLTQLDGTVEPLHVKLVKNFFFVMQKASIWNLNVFVRIQAVLLPNQQEQIVPTVVSKNVSKLE